MPAGSQSRRRSWQKTGVAAAVALATVLTAIPAASAASRRPTRIRLTPVATVAPDTHETVGGRLIAVGHARAIAHAAVRLSWSSDSGRHFRTLGSVRTTARGGFRFTIAPHTSGLLKVAYAGTGKWRRSTITRSIRVKAAQAPSAVSTPAAPPAAVPPATSAPPGTSSGSPTPAPAPVAPTGTQPAPGGGGFSRPTPPAPPGVRSRQPRHGTAGGSMGTVRGAYRSDYPWISWGLPSPGSGKFARSQAAANQQRP